MKGVLLAGGNGTRLLPMTRVTNKHMLPVAGKPMMQWPLEKLVQAGVERVCIVTGYQHIGHIVSYFGDGSEFGCDLTYRVQMQASGIAHALGLCRNFVGDERVFVVLGDQIFDSLIPDLGDGKDALVYVRKVEDAHRFGVVDLSHKMIVEKPADPPTNLATVGLYSYPPEVFGVIDELTPSKRGELEITDVNNNFWRLDRLSLVWLPGRWTDAGTPETYAKAQEVVL